MIDQLLEFAHSQIAYAPYIIFGLLLLAGFNIPVSEDLMLFTSAILAAKNPEYLWPLFFAVYAGAFLSDIICFSLGWFFGPQLFKIKWFSKMVTPQRLTSLQNFYHKYGIWTLVVGRFIPFGVRNGLFLSAGLGKMNPVKFSLADGFAATLSCSLFFTLYYKFGEAVLDGVKKANTILFIVALAVVLLVLARKSKKKHDFSK